MNKYNSKIIQNRDFDDDMRIQTIQFTKKTSKYLSNKNVAEINDIIENMPGEDDKYYYNRSFSIVASTPSSTFFTIKAISDDLKYRTLDEYLKGRVNKSKLEKINSIHVKIFTQRTEKEKKVFKKSFKK